MESSWEEHETWELAGLEVLNMAAFGDRSADEALCP
jgi:hypothetical protein